MKGAPYRFYEPHECTGAKGYPPEWHETLKHAVREASGNRCVRCLHPYIGGQGEWSRCDERCLHHGPVRYGDGIEWHEEELPDQIAASAVAVAWPICEARYRILTVHHLDGNKGNCRWWNLVALCQRCHLQIQGRVRMERVWPWEHSEWFRPYVAGYYAWTYLGEDLTREEVEARLDELLALECSGSASLSGDREGEK